MSQTKITGLGAEIYWALENAFKNKGDPMPVTGTAVHQPFNPMEGDISLPYPSYEEEVVFTSDSLDPNINLSHTVKLNPGNTGFPNDKGMIYHDPQFMLAMVFTHKAVSGTWSGGAATYGKITGDFTAYDHIDTCMIQYKLIDDELTTKFSETLNGILATEFKIGFDKGGVLRTKYNLISAQMQPNTQAYSADGNFDDGHWGDWAKSTYYPASGCRVYWDDSFAAEFVDIDVYSCWFTIGIPKEMLTEGGSLVPLLYKAGNRKFTAEVIGNIRGDTELDELYALLSAKTKKNLRLQWDITANEGKFMDIDDAFIKKIDARKIPGAANNYEGTLTLEGFTCDFEGNYENLPDPSARITIA